MKLVCQACQRLVLIERQLELFVTIALVIFYSVVAGVGLAALSDTQRVVESVLQNSRN